MSETIHKVCENCELLSLEGNHDGPRQCIKAFQRAMIEQRESAQRQGMEMSIHFLRALEELSIRPDVGFRYTIINPETNEQQVLPAQHVSGIFASLLRVYRQQSEFKTDKEQQRSATHWSMMAGKIGGLLQIFMERYDIADEDKAEAHTLLESVAIDDGSGPTVQELREELSAEQHGNVKFQHALHRARNELGDHVSMELKQMLTALLGPSDSPGLSG
jgi:hypothetical protein